MKLEIYSRDDRTLVQGIITEKRAGTGAAAGRVTNIKIKANVYNTATKSEEEKEIEIAFWNGDKNKLAESADSRLKVGDYVSALVTLNEKGNYSALSFKKAGQWYFPAVEEDPTTGASAQPERNIFIGTISSGTMSADGRCFRASMPVVEYNSETGDSETKWKGITFWNNDDAERPSKLGTNAEKCLKPYTPTDGGKAIHRRAAVVCGPVSTYFDSMGEERESYSAYRFERTDN